MSLASERRLRALVASRAGGVCEYCLIHEDDTFFGCEADHIVSRKHGGLSHPDNLAYACLCCNRHKGSDIASLAAGGQALVRLFNLRIDRWVEHFRFDRRSGVIEPLTQVGEATVRVLGLNRAERLLERQALVAVGRYPTQAASTRLPDCGRRPRWGARAALLVRVRRIHGQTGVVMRPRSAG